ncbi:phospholipase [candidate division KSB1 bacterium]|nr:phospholipase [candidate division KSB1 bacterium]
MAVQERNIKIIRTARYQELCTAGDKVRKVWFVLHGYGHLAAYFIKSFESLDVDENCVIAPEGLSRFYLQGFSGRVGASWMTREDRLHEIQNYVGYLDAVYEDVFKRVNRDQVSVTALGFSQGAATVSRWLCFGNGRIDHLIVWAGLIPHDLLEPTHSHCFHGVGLTLVHGTQDEMATRDGVAEQEKLLQRSAVQYNVVAFEGGHTLDSEVLLKVAEEIA